MKERLQIFNSKNNNNNNNNNNSNVPYRSVTKRIIPNTNVPSSNAPNSNVPNTNNIPNSNVPLKSEPNIKKEEPKKLVINPDLYGKDGNIRIMASKDKVNVRQSRRDNMNIKITDNNKNENDLQEYLHGNKFGKGREYNNNGQVIYEGDYANNQKLVKKIPIKDGKLDIDFRSPLNILNNYLN